MKREKTILSTAVILLLMALLGIGYFYSANKSITSILNKERLNAEKALSEKLELDKEIELFKNRVNALSGQNAEMDKMLAQTNQKLSEKENQLRRIYRENGNIKELKKQVAELNQMKKDFDAQVLSLNEMIKSLNKEKNALNQTIASLQNENKQLATNLDILSSMSSDNFLVETTRKKDKLTVMAKRTRKMTVSFNVPNNVSENISFRIIKPDGSKVDGKDNGVAYRVVNPEEGLTASTSAVLETVKVSRKIEMTYQPKDKQKPGIYKIEMYNGDKYIGACNVKLR
ncbi:MAG: hypothetical protein ACM3P1_05195 [Candidatus Saccharibacteria bacterium]